MRPFSNAAFRMNNLKSVEIGIWIAKMNMLHELFKSEPLLALFITIALGYLVGKIKIGSFVLGGIAGTLLVGVVIGQLGIDIDSGIKNIFFALFIYAVGFKADRSSSMR